MFGGRWLCLVGGEGGGVFGGVIWVCTITIGAF
jgi:hypothetical protein